MINVRRNPTPRPRGNRVDPTVVREPAKIKPPCLPCASGSRVAQHSCGR